MVLTSSFLFALRAYNYCSSVYTRVNDLVLQLYDSVVFMYSEKVYLLFDNNPSPYLLSSVNIGAPSSAVPQWYYNANKHAFIFWKLGESYENLRKVYERFDNLPLLSMEVTRGDECVHELDRFVDKLTFYKPADTPFPSVGHIIAAWSLSSKVVIDGNRDFMVSITTNTAEYVRTPVYTYASIDTVVTPQRVLKIE